MAMLPSQAVPTTAHRKAEKRTEGGEKRRRHNLGGSRWVR